MITTIIILSIVLIGILIISKIPSIKIEDKTYHVWCGIIISLIGGFSVYELFKMNIWYFFLAAFLSGTAAAFFKEFVIDKLLKLGQFDWKDLIATMWGALIGSFITIAVLGTINHLGDPKINP